MTQPDSIQSTIVHFLRTIPETWIDHDPSAQSELQERAVELLTAAGMIERRVTLRLRMAGHPLAIEATVTMTGEAGLAQAMEYVLRDSWNDWRNTFEKHGGGPSAHCERIGNEQWRLTAEGVVARSDLDAGNSAPVFDFVLRRGFFDGGPRLIPDGNIRQRLPVAGRGALERLRRVSSDAGPLDVAIANWEAGGAAFAAAFAELLKAKTAATEPSTSRESNPSFALLRVFTNGIVDERIKNAAQILDDDNLTANEKLTRIDGLIHFPPTASAEQLGEMLGVSKQAVLKTPWWRKHRRGDLKDQIGRRHAQHKERAKCFEPPRQDDDDER